MYLKVIDIIQPCRMGSKYFTDGRSEFPAADHVDEWAVNGVNQGRLSDVRRLISNIENRAKEYLIFQLNIEYHKRQSSAFTAHLLTNR